MVGWHCNSDPIRAPPTYKGEKAGAEQQEWTYTKETPFLAITSNCKLSWYLGKTSKNIEKIVTAWSRHSHAALEPPSPGRLHWSSHLCIFPWHQAPGPQMPKANKASMIFICAIPKKCFWFDVSAEPLDSGHLNSPPTDLWSCLVCVCSVVCVWHDRSCGRPFMPSSKALQES